MDKNVTIPISILLGSALIGAGLYFGLRDRSAEPAASTMVDRERATTAPGLATGAAAAPPATQAAIPLPAALALAPPSAPKEVEEAAKKGAEAALEAERKKLVKTCWAPAIAKEPAPAKSKYLFQMTFNAEGKEVARGISETREDSRPDVARCLREQPMGLSIAAPGRLVAVDVTFSMP